MGAAVIAEEKRTLLKSANPPPADELTFVVIGDPTQPRGLSSVLLGLRIPFLEIQAYEPAPETPYDTIIVIREYDAAADIPDDLTNVLAVVNTVLLGGPYVHADYHSVDLSTVPPENILEETSLGGTTTKYFVPTRTLPLLEPLRDIGVPDELVDVVEKPGARGRRLRIRPCSARERRRDGGQRVGDADQPRCLTEYLLPAEWYHNNEPGVGDQ